MVRGSPATELLTVPEPSVTRAVRAMPTTPLASGSKKRAAGVVLLRAQEQAGACRRTLQQKSATESAQSAEVERREPLTNGAGLTRHGAADRAGTVGDARGKGNADDPTRLWQQKESRWRGEAPAAS